MKIISMLKKQFLQYKNFCMYLGVSIFVLVVDIFISRICEAFVIYEVANSIGIITGAVIQYFLLTHHVYNINNFRVFLKFVLTFFGGLILANGIVFVCRRMIFTDSTTLMAFLVGKGASVVIPFFALYFVREKWIQQPKEK